MTGVVFPKVVWDAEGFRYCEFTYDPGYPDDEMDYLRDRRLRAKRNGFEVRKEEE